MNAKLPYAIAAAIQERKGDITMDAEIKLDGVLA